MKTYDYSMIYYCIQKNKDCILGLLLLIDFEKAFDSVSWSFMQKCLDFFNFGPDVKRWIKTFHTNISPCVSVNGHDTKLFGVHRGVRQGDPCSP